MTKKNTIYQASIMPASRDRIWPYLKSGKTLRYAIYPIVRLIPEDPEAGDDLTVGRTLRYREKLFGFIPLGTFAMTVLKIDDDACEVETRGVSAGLPVWKHFVTLKYVTNKHTLYSDEVHFESGMVSPFIRFWGNAYYSYRQRRCARFLLSGKKKVPEPKFVSAGEAAGMLVKEENLALGAAALLIVSAGILLDRRDR